ncbi:hypothetical protein T440DRAFT_516380 [Plenodomus tracheiphilus IPT5]|uniref:Uncharacterized protein n=1 Tax=Plenodomus tracheiphilus IPT5 TaxID=1408161 RepID=A0A6A7BAH7_9PLEO|nr:hypothetical protein T440DRAFT_516380 [Plenodomus tracheiphilus IPT5]
MNVKLQQPQPSVSTNWSAYSLRLKKWPLMKFGRALSWSARESKDASHSNVISNRAARSPSRRLHRLAQNISHDPKWTRPLQINREPLQQLEPFDLPPIAPATIDTVDWPRSPFGAFGNLNSDRINAEPLGAVTTIHHGLGTSQSAFGVPSMNTFGCRYNAAYTNSVPADDVANCRQDEGHQYGGNHFAASQSNASSNLLAGLTQIANCNVNPAGNNTAAVQGHEINNYSFLNNETMLDGIPDFNNLNRDLLVNYTRASDYQNMIADNGSFVDQNTGFTQVDPSVLGGHNSHITISANTNPGQDPSHWWHPAYPPVNSMVEGEMSRWKMSMATASNSEDLKFTKPSLNRYLTKLVSVVIMSQKVNGSDALIPSVASQRGPKTDQIPVKKTAGGKVSKPRKSVKAPVSRPSARTDTSMPSKPVLTMGWSTKLCGTKSLVMKVKLPVLREYRFYVQSKMTASQKELKKQKNHGNAAQKGGLLFPASGNDTIPDTRMDFDMRVNGLVTAMLKNKDCLEVEDTNEYKKRWADGAMYYSPEYMHAAAAEVVNEMVNIHKSGWTKSVHDSDRRDLFKKTMFFTFEDRERFWALLGNPGELLKHAIANERQDRIRRERLRRAAEAEKAEKEQKRAREDDEGEEEAGPLKRTCTT